MMVRTQEWLGVQQNNSRAITFLPKSLDYIKFEHGISLSLSFPSLIHVLTHTHTQCHSSKVLNPASNLCTFRHYLVNGHAVFSEKTRSSLP